MLLYYIRHGQPIYNPDSLTEEGHLQAEALAKRLSLYGLDKIYSSTSNRAIETAKPTSDNLNIPIITLDCFNETYAWKYFTIEKEDKTRSWVFYTDKYLKLFSLKDIRINDKWYLDERFKDTQFKEGIEFVNKNVDEFIKKLGYNHDREKGIYIPINHNDKRVALFAHQGMGLAFLSSLLDIPYPEFCTRFDLGHSSMTIIEFDVINGVSIPKVLTYSNDSHLYKEDLNTEYNFKIKF